MDDSDRSESAVPRVAMPAQLVFAFEEWIVEALRQACDHFAKPEARAAVIQAVHLHDRFVAGTLTPAQIAELAARAADWLHPSWPESVEDADEVERLLGTARQLFELRDRALAVAGDSDDVPRLVTVDAALREVLRSQTLMAGVRPRAIRAAARSPAGRVAGACDDVSRCLRDPRRHRLAPDATDHRGRGGDHAEPSRATGAPARRSRAIDRRAARYPARPDRCRRHHPHRRVHPGRPPNRGRTPAAPAAPAGRDTGVIDVGRHDAL
jgi:hypothetical protein